MHDTIRLLRRFFLVWVGVIYVAGLVVVLSPAVIPVCPSRNVDSCALRFEGTLVPWSSFLAFSLLLSLYGCLLWLSLSGKAHRRLLWPSLLAQAVLVVAVYLVLRQLDLTLSLYLALTLESIALVEQRRLRLVIAIAAGYVLLLVVLLTLFGIENWRNAKYFWTAIYQNTPAYLAQILFLGGYLLLYVQLARSHERLETAASQIEALTRSAERQRLARDLHDTLAQGLTGLILQLEAVKAGLHSHRHERAEEIVIQALAGARGALADARGAIQDLRTQAPTPASLPQLIRQEISRFAATTGITCTMELAALADVPMAWCEQVLRAITEGLSNVARHAQATHVWVTTVQNEATLEIMVRDDGIGFEPKTVVSDDGDDSDHGDHNDLGDHGHYGLLGLRERARLAGGRLDITSGPGVGTILRLCLPYQGQARPNSRAQEGQATPLLREEAPGGQA
jgi:NarL family two-component system sensor histidine kinase YdfH